MFHFRNFQLTLSYLFFSMIFKDIEDVSMLNSRKNCFVKKIVSIAYKSRTGSHQNLLQQENTVHKPKSKI